MFGGLAHDAGATWSSARTPVAPGCPCCSPVCSASATSFVIDAAAQLIVGLDDPTTSTPNDPYLQVLVNGHLQMGALGKLGMVDSGFRISAAAWSRTCRSA